MKGTDKKKVSNNSGASYGHQTPKKEHTRKNDVACKINNADDVFS